MAGYYPPVGFHFSVDFDLDGLKSNDHLFQEVSGIEAELETETVKEGGENRFVHTLPIRSKYSDLILKRGLLTESKVIEWCKDAVENLIIQPITIRVHLLNEKSESLQTYSFVNAWPKKWSISSFNAEDSKVVVETMVIVYQYFKVL